MGVNGIYGLSGSGLDIESMVKVGMMSKQNEYDKMAQKFTKNEWMKADYLELNSKITTFNASTLSQYKMSNTMNAKSAESTSSAVKVSANSSAPLMNHKVDVAALSSNDYLISTQKLARNSSADSDSIYLKDILFQNLKKNSDGTISGQTFAADSVTGGVKYIASGSYPSATSGLKGISFFISDGVTKDKDAAETDPAKKVEISFTYDEILEGATLNDLASKINAAGLNIRASYDSVQDQFSLYNTKGGSDNKIDIETGSNWETTITAAGQAAANFFEGLGLYQSKDGVLYSTDGTAKDSGGTALAFTRTNGSVQNSSISTSGTNGSIWVDGVRYETTDNKVTVGGITYNALNTTTSETYNNTTKEYTLNSTANSATVSVSQDTDSIIEKVKSFVTDYNKLLASLYEKYDEKPNSDYKPLTQSQKDQMKDEQIEKWEEKAKAGLLYHDQTLGKVIMNMRNAVSESVDGIDSKYNSIYSLGISTTGLKGQLVLDEDKLRKAMAEDPDAVYNVFAKLESATTDNKNAVYQTDSDGNVTSTSNGNGIAQRLGDIFVSANKLIRERAGSSADITEDSDLNSLLRNLQTKMSNFKKMMNSFEDALYKKYDAMESTLAKLGTQLNFVMGNAGQ
ncbi:MAG: flagellar filament capping protein FliD [Selenomonadaceae bacterium]|nr:flagellar filament capping protein FliD [Selenomonadaceae bacterium]